jgi:hypothetical protein
MTFAVLQSSDEEEQGSAKGEAQKREGHEFSLVPLSLPKYDRALAPEVSF